MLGLSHREQILCAFLLAMIMAVAVAGAWLTWQTLKDQQVQLEGQSAAQSEVKDEHSLEADLTKREGFNLAKSPAAPGTASRTAPTERVGGSGRTAPSLQTSKPTTIDGTIVASVVTMVLLGAAAGAARLVLARYRRRHADDAGAGRAQRSFVDLIGEDSDLDPDEAVVADEDDRSREAALHQDTEGSPSEDPPVEGQPLAAAERAELEQSGLDVPEARPGAASMFEEQPTALPEGESLLLDSPVVPAPRSSSWDVRQEADVSGRSSGPLASPLLEESSSFSVATQDAASENIFDRRVARRVPHVESAWLWWGDANGPVMVQDLSATGLRLRFPPPGSTPPPTLGQSLRIFFPVSGTTVKAQGRVQWRRTVDGATEAGLQFLDLSAGDQELIEAVLLAAE